MSTFLGAVLPKVLESGELFFISVLVDYSYVDDILISLFLLNDRAARYEISGRFKVLFYLLSTVCKKAFSMPFSFTLFFWYILLLPGCIQSFQLVFDILKILLNYVCVCVCFNLSCCVFYKLFQLEILRL